MNGFHLIVYLKNLILNINVLFNEFGFVIDSGAVVRSNGMGSHRFVDEAFRSIGCFIRITVLLSQHFKKTVNYKIYGIYFAYIIIQLRLFSLR